LYLPEITKILYYYYIIAYIWQHVNDKPVITGKVELLEEFFTHCRISIIMNYLGEVKHSMKYLENAVKFFGKFYILAIPLLVLNALPALIQGGVTINVISTFTRFFESYNITKGFQDPGAFLHMIPGILSFVVSASILAVVLQLVAEPATYGMVNKALQVGWADLNDLIPAIKQNFVKYLLYWVGIIVVSAVFGIAATIVFIILILLTMAIKWFGVILIVLAALAFIIAGVILYTLISLWFPAMVIDDMDVMSALKQSVEIVKSTFWTILGIRILLVVIGGIASSIVGAFVGWIPVIGTIITSVIPTVVNFILIVFFLEIYRDRTGKAVSV